MTDEEKKVEEVCGVKNGKCCCELFSKFLMITAAVFTGTLLALLVAKGLTQPKFPPCPCMMKGYRPGIERQLPPPQFGEHKTHRRHFKGEKQKFNKGERLPKELQERD